MFALRARGATALLVTHDQEEALGMADLVAVLRDGAVAQLGTPQQVYTEPADLGAALFNGDTVDTSLGRLPIAGHTGSAGTVLHPEQVLIDNTARHGVAATVTDVHGHGHDATVLLRLSDGQQVRSRVQGPLPAGRGDSVTVTVSGTARFLPPAPSCSSRRS